ncbi:sulfurtransferase [Corynebacterium heidelbergense]|uniref:Sulfurtransferase n=1 Tax=Corynebacterium heidelbergense TaxID=2055947 RepID=A0A364VDR1_9CORY|nr:sulfurtransferase [Corynebacterium heidelbergense]RAV34802.1 sulfurtransferase [Corynebacterium heidelbergense]WCZ37229.1 Putative thiosulfate sulfurtransferase SseA [Corynebacterium heidelbergense]
MAIERDPSPILEQYANPGKIVTNAWLGAKLGTPGLKVVESDEDSLLYDIGHIPTAVRINWGADLNDPVRRDFVSPRDFADLMDAKGIARDDTVVIYGDQSNLWAAYTLWVFELFGHPDVRLLDGGRDAWMREEKETSYSVPNRPTSGYPVVERLNTQERIFADELRESLPELQLIDLREPEDYAGLPARVGACNHPTPTGFSRTGHLPGSVNFALVSALHPNTRFRSRAELQELMRGFDPETATVAYCDNGARAAHLWFVLRYLLGWGNVRVYDGSWIEWGNMIGVPIEVSKREAPVKKSASGRTSPPKAGRKKPGGAKRAAKR